jgi:hypothetical protein
MNSDVLVGCWVVAAVLLISAFGSPIMLKLSGLWDVPQARVGFRWTQRILLALAGALFVLAPILGLIIR